MKTKDPDVREESSHRWTLALIVTVISIAGIGVMAAFVIICSVDKDKAAQLVMSAVLPLLAAWVGTVLAYYYSSESLEAATRSVKDLMTVEEKLKSIPVGSVMIKVGDMLYFTYSDTLNIMEILNKLEVSKKGDRLPFLGDGKQPMFIFHQSALDNALVKSSTSPGTDINKITLLDLFTKVPALKELGEKTFGVVNKDATLAIAQAEMRRIENCQDVFVTETGRKDSAVVGWITNNIIEQNSKV